MKKALLVTLALFVTAHAQAQDTSGVRILRAEDLQLDAAQEHTLSQWTDDVLEYRDWLDRNRNRIARNVFGFISERRQMPGVPEWLPAKCEVLEEVGPPTSAVLTDACHLLAYYQSDFTRDPSAQQRLLTQKQNEEDPHSSFWKHVHLDAGWGSLDYRMKTYGLVGVHVTLPELAKRVQIYLPPGFLLLSMPDGFGGRTLQPAATIGVSIKMFQFAFPQQKAGSAYFNIAKAYVIGRAAPSGSNAAVDLVGLSFSWGE
jgi:hypothetical protein